MLTSKVPDGTTLPTDTWVYSRFHDFEQQTSVKPAQLYGRLCLEYPALLGTFGGILYMSGHLSAKMGLEPPILCSPHKVNDCSECGQ